MGKEMVQAQSLVYEYKKYDEEGRETDVMRWPPYPCRWRRVIL